MRRKFKSYRLSNRAETDLAEIAEYTVAQWSIDQADRYIADIQRAILGLVDGRKVGRRRREIGEPYFFLATGSHVIVYRAGEDILVERILHQAMDIAQHLDA